MSALASIPDEHRVDPSRARCWSVSSGGSWTIVVATCKEEARLLGLIWIAAHHGRSRVEFAARARVTEADPAKVRRWLECRAQERAGVAAARSQP